MVTFWSGVVIEFVELGLATIIILYNNRTILEFLFVFDLVLLMFYNSFCSFWYSSIQYKACWKPINAQSQTWFENYIIYTYKTNYNSISSPQCDRSCRIDSFCASFIYNYIKCPWLWSLTRPLWLHLKRPSVSVLNPRNFLRINLVLNVHKRI